MLYLEEQLYDELKKELASMDIPLTRENIEIASLAMQNLLSRNPDAVMLLVESSEPDELPRDIIKILPPDYLEGLGDLGKSKSKRHKQKINYIMNETAKRIAAVQANPNLTAEQKAAEIAEAQGVMNAQTGAENKHNKKVKKAAKAKVIKAVAIGAALVTGGILLGAPGAIANVASKAVSSTGIIGKQFTSQGLISKAFTLNPKDLVNPESIGGKLVSNLASKLTAGKEKLDTSSLGSAMVDAGVSDALDKISKVTGLNTDKLQNAANNLIGGAGYQANSALDSGTVLPDTTSQTEGTTETETQAKTEESFFSKKNLPLIAGIGGGSLLLLTGLIILTRR